MTQDSNLESLRYVDGKMTLLDQLQLPLIVHYDAITSVQDGWDAIREMKVRGAPAIAVAAALSLSVEILSMTKANKFSDTSALKEHALEQLEHLKSSRPTAVNLFNMADWFKVYIEDKYEVLSKDSVLELAEAIDEKAKKMMVDDVSKNKLIGDHGAEAMVKMTQKKDELRVLTHCNTGSLATAGYGTALGVLRSLHAQNLLKRAYCTETRPYLQGARLTAFELSHDKLPGTLIADSMVSMLFKNKMADAVVVGADRIVANGDTANKIGTYQIAISCAYHKIPFFIAAPTTTIDLSLKSGDQIVIEERAATEMKSISGVMFADPDIEVWNPAFDVTPATLITGIITECGTFYKPEGSDTFDLSSQIANIQLV
ncbi:methylthioribose-1-phosphate isomerase [Sphaeroforma arctica JP610]|uniref:Methylthioribose-1-phosphate isomerase n=1 Tax=Sphaeroforma arctica JP610 TaxID=667725 RepID=A0A0L0GAG1_9EUKA|nr:methylthioribose-1-phosphate isomerase [Sphaeroforma arctica JP610]KNC86017.1 methylthioribose-1-phosphate isomerase [Sphaeroforma arctica JP610]|eukprot:XP_014159919.1 methylthioribose-1-phosphate isomerase [Sphaeroforma arctica JP610]